MARRPTGPAGPTPVEAFTHGEKRTNIPTADAAADWVDEDELHLEPVRYPRNTALDPQLVWRGKDAQDGEDLVVDAPPLYIQEKIDPRVLIENLRKTAAAGQREPELTLFDHFDGLDELAQVEFYQHEANWSNRMILGDSLQAMGSLAEREALRGRVQMIYIDPPYGIRFGSNWQVSARKRDVKDGKIEDAVREAEQIKAFRDTWQDGIHTYLSYLRDRLVVARDLLTESGSVFLQIGDENVHLVRSLLDEVFGRENFVSQVTVGKLSGVQSRALAATADYILWFARELDALRYRQLYIARSDEADSRYDQVDDAGHRYQLDNLTSSGPASEPQEVSHAGRTYSPSNGNHWKTNSAGMARLAIANRLAPARATLRYKRYAADFPVRESNNVWTDISGAVQSRSDPKIYVVQSSTSLIERCMLMTTDPGDLVLDPTCGSGTTAYVAEQWGRRWITIDTSRVALALARQRLMGGRYPYYLLADSPEGRNQEGVASGIPLPRTETHGDIRRGFVYDRVQHITLKSIANNPDIREGMSRDEIDAAIKRHADFELLYDKPYEDRKRVRVSGPFTVESLSPYRSLTFGEASNASAGAATGQNDPEGADFPQTILDSLQASGVQNGRRNERIEFASLDPYAGTYVQAVGERAAATRPSRSGEAAYRDAADLDTAAAPPTRSPGSEAAPPTRSPGGGIAIAIGPQYGTVSPGFVKSAAREALRAPGVGLLYVLGFAFDPNASGVTEADGVTIDVGDEGFEVSGERKLGRLVVQFVRMNAELLMGDALKKTGAGNLFTVFGEPDIEIRATSGAASDDLLEVELHGVDVYDPTTGQVRSRQTDRVALWMIDTEYDDESFFVRHCYFTGGNDPYKRLKVALKADIDPDAWAALYRTVSLPFDRPSSGKIAVKVINDYGDEVMKVFDVAGDGA